MAKFDQSSKHLAEVAEFYEDYGEHFARTRFALWPWMKEVADQLKAGMTVVDIGAGNGRFSEAFVEGVNYIGVEPSSALRLAAQSKMRTGMRMEAGQLPVIALEDNIADLTACIAVLHHVPKDLHEASIRELVRITKPGGTICISVWNARGKGFLRYPKAWSAAWLRLPLWKGLAPGECYVPWKSGDLLAQRYVYAWTKSELQRLGSRYAEVISCDYIDAQKTNALDGKNILLLLKKAQ